MTCLLLTQSGDSRAAWRSSAAMNPGVTIWRIYFGSRLLRVFTSDVRYWPKADMSCCAARVRFRGQSRHGLLHCTCLLLTQSGHWRCTAAMVLMVVSAPTKVLV